LKAVSNPPWYSKPGLTQTSIARAREILSELFIDTALDELDLAHLAEWLLATDLSLTEIEHIYQDEVAPVCSGNFAPIGPWPAFDFDWLHAEIERRSSSWTRRLPSAWQMVRRRWHTCGTKENWRIVRHHLQEPARLHSKLVRLRAMISPP
jgi:hypothetical protein